VATRASRPGARSALARALRRGLRRLRRTPGSLDPLAAGDRPGEVFEASWRPLMKGRVLVMVAVLGVWVVGIQARLVQLQVFQHEWLADMAAQRHQRVLTVEAPRGDIVDRNGRRLAYSVEAHTIWADPTLVVDPEATVRALCDALGDCDPAERRGMLEQLVRAVKRDPPDRHVELRDPRRASPLQVERVAGLDLPGIGLTPGSHRYYPHKELAAHVLGYTRVDHVGQAGIEYAFDDVIRGEPGVTIAQVDARARRLDTRVERVPVPGATLELTLDLAIQHIVERELKRGVIEHRARAGTAVVMNPTTGEVLGLAAYPTFNPNAPGLSGEDELRNLAVQAAYEPGSTFKIVTAAAALEQGIVKTTDVIDCAPGYIVLPGRRIVDEAGGHNYGALTFEDVIVKSSNVGAIKVGLRTGAGRLIEYVERFGFGQRNMRDLAGVSAGIWAPAGLDDNGVASVSMGYQIGVTPLQMASAASVVANGGLLMRPVLVRAIVRNGQREVRRPDVLRRAIQPETAATLTAIMEAVTERGTARAARLDRYQVAGKTGTATQVVDGAYSEGDTNASFVGFVPSRRPALTILVVIDRPRAGSQYGGAVAAPVFHRIATAALRHLAIPPTIDPLPPVLASDALPPPAPLALPAIVRTSAALGGPALMPDLRGLGARAAFRALADVGLAVRRVSGAGFVVHQTPAPGDPITSETWTALELDRRPALAPDAGGPR
jgi:cell division protein FtsI/penicillin-binding protein 2